MLRPRRAGRENDGSEHRRTDSTTASRPTHERLRQLALLKLPELDDLIALATSVRLILKICSRCSCDSIDVCRMFRRARPTPPRADPHQCGDRDEAGQEEREHPGCDFNLG